MSRNGHLHPFFVGGGLDLNSGNRGCARLGGEVVPRLGVVKNDTAVLVVLVRRHCCAVGAAARRAGPWVPGAVEEETGSVCPQAFLMRCLYTPLVRSASSL